MRTPSYQNILPLDYKLQMKKSSPNAHKKVVEIDFSFQIWTLSLSQSLSVCLFISFILPLENRRLSKWLPIKDNLIQF